MFSDITSITGWRSQLLCLPSRVMNWALCLGLSVQVPRVYLYSSMQGCSGVLLVLFIVNYI